MVRRYFSRSLPNKSAQTLQNEMLSQLRRESESLMNQLTRQFTDTLQQLQKDAAQSVADSVRSSSSGKNDDSISTSQARLLANAIGFLINRPKIKTRETESARSINANAEFRLSHSQMLVEAAQSLQNGDKNR